MASGGKRGGAGERVLEGRHVIGLFFLMLLFSGIFFTLGFVMGRQQYDGQVRAASTTHGGSEAPAPLKPEAKKPNNFVSSGPSADPAARPSSDWDMYDTRNPAPASDRMRPAPAPAAKPASVAKNDPAPRASGSRKTPNAPLIPGGAYSLQVAALTRESDAIGLANALQKKKFPAFVLSPSTDKYFHVHVGPYADQKAAEAARKGLVGLGFNAIVKRG